MKEQQSIIDTGNFKFDCNQNQAEVTKFHEIIQTQETGQDLENTLEKYEKGGTLLSAVKS